MAPFGYPYMCLLHFFAYLYTISLVILTYFYLLCKYFFVYRIQVSKGHKPLVLAQWWFNVLLTRHNISIKVGRQLHDMRILCRIEELFYRKTKNENRYTTHIYLSSPKSNLIISCTNKLSNFLVAHFTCYSILSVLNSSIISIFT